MNYRMIEEFMLMANMTVARYILEKFPVGAMLRRHPPPRNGVLEEVVRNLIYTVWNLVLGTGSI